ncbi:1,2-phenylacetyl-CoA epoxidase subunit PaaE [Oricola cellulosilytica]|uniref:Phenylacetate-CoA oxygenase/reductase subunit PaaK n=1 Tax=Oricola cellulosilytica TaxID=1429082 RepID=A0A4R0P7L8_9HYPH|nr:1,2-phenylacetyl-CoA epoxidase subunit PaaE [Oricola cellulosilytica]TCD11889.1 phenylacetate-CoA oxygenase/reductase subunit PaaK [Oricola cellulosilytica]
MAKFYELRVTDVKHETRDAVAVTLAPTEDAANAFDFTQGQYLTLRKQFDGEELRRSYSICAGKDEGILRVGIKKVDGGAFSTWANEDLKPGDVVEAMPPMGRFFAPIEPAREKHYLGFAIGSGITPVLSILKTVLAREPLSRFTLVYGNRSIHSIMFREELQDLKNTYLGRFNIIHILKNDAQEIDLFTGRIDAGKCEMLFKSWIDVSTADMAFICGPEDMMKTVSASLKAHGMPADSIKFELFNATQSGRAAKRAPIDPIHAGVTTKAVVTLDGTTREIDVVAGQTVLEAASAAGFDAPYSCRAGVCCTCRARVTEGEVEMDANHALEDYEVRAGYVLTCQSHPITDRIVVDYDHH